MGENIQHGLSQDVLGERLHVTRQTVSNWETGKSSLDLAILVCIAFHLFYPGPLLLFYLAGAYLIAPRLT